MPEYNYIYVALIFIWKLETHRIIRRCQGNSANFHLKPRTDVTRIKNKGVIDTTEGGPPKVSWTLVTYVKKIERNWIDHGIDMLLKQISEKYFFRTYEKVRRLGKLFCRTLINVRMKTGLWRCKSFGIYNPANEKRVAVTGCRHSKDSTGDLI